MALRASWLLKVWRHKGWAARLLLVFALPCGWLVALHKTLYQLRLRPTHRVDALVVVAGNVVAGGAGKTPTVIGMAQHLVQRGISVGIVSRGYGRSEGGMQAVHADSLPSQVGDEPLLMHRATGCPVFVDANRGKAARALLAQHPQVQVILCDDGLQHLALYRDIEVCVFDDRGVGNGWLMPAGPLREPWPRRYVGVCGQTAGTTLVLHTGKQPKFGGFRAHRALAPLALARDGTVVSLQTLTAVRQKPLYAVAGLAQPEAFFAMLQALQLPLAGTLGLPDHCDFQDFDRTLGERYTLLCTEKDAAKLWPVAPDALAVPLVQTMEDGFWQALDALVLTRLSLPHGHQTA